MAKKGGHYVHVDNSGNEFHFGGSLNEASNITYTKGSATNALNATNTQGAIDTLRDRVGNPSSLPDSSKSVIDNISALNSNLEMCYDYVSVNLLTVNGNTDIAVDLSSIIDFNKCFFVIPYGYNVGSSWNTTLIFKTLDYANKKLYVRTNGNTAQLYAIYFLRCQLKSKI